MTNRYLQKTFKMTPTRNNALFDGPEHPSDEITVKILLKKSVSLVLKDLNKQFTTVDKIDMKASPDDQNRNAIVVRGIRPYDGYDAQDVLKVVKNVDGGAKIIR